MVFFSNAQGTNVQIVADPVNQGSTNANEVIFAGPFASSNTVTVTYRTPNGISLTPRILSLVDGAQIIDGVEYNAWTGLLDSAVTEFAGTVTAMFSITASEGTTIVTNPAYFEVHEGVYVEPPADPSADVWGKILTALTTVKESVDNLRKDTDGNTASITALDSVVSSHSTKIADLSSNKLDKQTGETANHMVYAKTPDGAQEMLPFPSGTLANIKDGEPVGSLEQLSSKAQGEYDAAFGSGNTTSVKGYYIAGVYFSDNQTIFILDYTFWPQITVVTTPPVPDEETPTPEWAANDVALFTFSRDVTLTAPIQNVDHNLLYIGKNLENVVPTTRVTDERSNSNSVCIPSKPTAGHVKLTNGGASTGAHNIAAGNNATVSGEGNIAGGDCSDVGGFDCVGNALAAFVRGIGASATGLGSHAEGKSTKASGTSSHAEGNETVASGDCSHAEGNKTKASGPYSHAEGGHYETYKEAYGAISDYTHAEGLDTLASARGGHAEGFRSVAAGPYSHAEGQAVAAAWQSHAEGSIDALAKGDYSHAECGGKAYGTRSHAEGSGRTGQPTGTAGALEAHAEGAGVALGVQSHAEGKSTVASGTASHAQGIGNTATAEGQFSAGRYSKEGQNGIGVNQDDGTMIVRIGAGTNTEPKTVFSIDVNGTACMRSGEVPTSSIVSGYNVINREYADAHYAPIGGAYKAKEKPYTLTMEKTKMCIWDQAEDPIFDASTGLFVAKDYGGNIVERTLEQVVQNGGTVPITFKPLYSTKKREETWGTMTDYYFPIWFSVTATENADGTVTLNGTMRYVAK